MGRDLLPPGLPEQCVSSMSSLGTGSVRAPTWSMKMVAHFSVQSAADPCSPLLDHP